MTMTPARTAATLLVTLYALLTTACATRDINDFCRYSEDRSLGDVSPESLALVIGVKPERVRQTPFVVVRNLSEDSPQAFLRLSASPAPHPLPLDLDESRCAGVDWTTYDLTVDPAEWRGFWQRGRAWPFEIAIAFLEDYSPLPVSGFGAAIVDAEAASQLVSCGCYWK